MAAIFGLFLVFWSVRAIYALTQRSYADRAPAAEPYPPPAEPIIPARPHIGDYSGGNMQ